MSEPVMFTRLPARVSGTDGVEVNRAAVVVHADGRAVVAVLSRGRSGHPEEIATLEGVTVEKHPNRTATLTGADGIVWTVERGDGCGCKSPLTAWLNQQVGTPRRVGT